MYRNMHALILYESLWKYSAEELLKLLMNITL